MHIAEDHNKPDDKSAGYVQPERQLGSTRCHQLAKALRLRPFTRLYFRSHGVKFSIKRLKKA